VELQIGKNHAAVIFQKIQIVKNHILGDNNLVKRFKNKEGIQKNNIFIKKLRNNLKFYYWV